MAKTQRICTCECGQKYRSETETVNAFSGDDVIGTRMVSLDSCPKCGKSDRIIGSKSPSKEEATLLEGISRTALKRLRGMKPDELKKLLELEQGDMKAPTPGEEGGT